MKRILYALAVIALAILVGCGPAGSTATIEPGIYYLFSATPILGFKQPLFAPFKQILPQNRCNSNTFFDLSHAKLCQPPVFRPQKAV